MPIPARRPKRRLPTAAARHPAPQYPGTVKTITRRELAAHTKAVLDDVEAGETYRVTRNGTEIAEVRPLSARRRFVPVDDLQRKWRDAPRADAQGLRRRNAIRGRAGWT